MQTFGAVDVQLHQVEKTSEEQEAKGTRHFERQTSEASTSQAR